MSIVVVLDQQAMRSSSGASMRFMSLCFVLFVSVAIFAPRFYWDLTHHATPTRALDFQQGGVGAIQLGMLVSSWLAHDSDSHAVLTQHWFALTITFFVAGIVQIHAHAVGVPVKILHWVAPIGIPIDVIVLLGVRPPAPLLKED
jgi:ABC-type dipeptide/oligopeptide/nickel transport system permease subunit